MLLIDIKDKELTQEEVEMLEHPLVSGLILFTRNFYDKAQIQALVKSIRQRVKKTVAYYCRPRRRSGATLP